jgi:hypothetical protein
VISASGANDRWQIIVNDAADGEADCRPIVNLSGEAGDEDR